MPLDGTAFLAPYVPVDAKVAEAALSLANLKSDDILCDLGCGDGRLLRQAPCGCIGVELDPHLIEFINADQKDDITSGKLRLIEQDFLTVDLIGLGVTCLVLYLLPNALEKLGPNMAAWLLSSSANRIVCIVYQVPGWHPANSIEAGNSTSFMGGKRGVQYLYYYDVFSIPE